MSDRARAGYFVLFASVVCNAAGFHFVHVGVRLTSPYTTVSVACVAAAVAFLVVGAALRASGQRGGRLREVTPAEMGRTFARSWRMLTTSAVIGGTGGLLIVATNERYGPETAAFLGNLTLVFLVLSGIALGERLRRAEMVTISGILIGAFLFSSQGGEVQWGALGLMGVACAFTAGKQLLTKTVVGRGNPYAAVGVNALLMGAWALAAGLATGNWAPPSPRALAFIVAGGLANSMVGMTLLYVGYNMIGVSRGAPIDALRPLAVLVIGLLLGKDWPAAAQIVGGGMVLGGFEQAMQAGGEALAVAAR